MNLTTIFSIAAEQALASVRNGYESQEAAPQPIRVGPRPKQDNFKLGQDLAAPQPMRIGPKTNASTASRKAA